MCSGSGRARSLPVRGLLARLKLCTAIHQNAQQNPLRLYRNMTGIHYFVLLGGKKVFVCSLDGDNPEVKAILEKEKAFLI